MKYIKKRLVITSDGVGLDALFAHLAPIVRRAHGLEGCIEYVPMPGGKWVPKSFHDQAVDTKAYGFIALPQKHWIPKGCSLRLDKMGVVEFAPQPEGLRVSRVRYLAREGKKWFAAAECVTAFQEELQQQRTEFLLALTEDDENTLHHMFRHMQYWQVEFRRSVHGNPVRSDGALEPWAARKIFRTRVDGNIHPLYVTTTTALGLMMQSPYFQQGGVKNLIFEEVTRGKRRNSILLDFVGEVVLDGKVPKAVNVVEIRYDEEDDAFFATFKS